jgi:O-antigen ligase
VGITTIRTVVQLKQLAWVIVLSQGYLAYEFNMSYYGGWNMLQEVGFAGQDNNTVAITLDACIGLAFFLALCSKRWWAKCLAFGLALLMMHAVMFSFSRGALLALIVTGGLTFYLIPKRGIHYLALILVILLGVRMAGKEVMERFATAFAKKEELDDSAKLRLKHWKACGDSILHKPWGVGPNQWRYTAVTYGLPKMEAHSYWLQMASECGIPGVLSLLAFYALCVLRLWPIAREKIPVSDPWLNHLARAVIAALAGFSFSAQFVSVTGVEVPFYVVLLGAGVIKLATAKPIADPVLEPVGYVAFLSAPPPQLPPIGGSVSSPGYSR